SVDSTGADVSGGATGDSEPPVGGVLYGMMREPQRPDVGDQPRRVVAPFPQPLAASRPGITRPSRARRPAPQAGGREDIRICGQRVPESATDLDGGREYRTVSQNARSDKPEPVPPNAS